MHLPHSYSGFTLLALSPPQTLAPLSPHQPPQVQHLFEQQKRNTYSLGRGMRLQRQEFPGKDGPGQPRNNPHSGDTCPLAVIKHPCCAQTGQKTQKTRKGARNSIWRTVFQCGKEQVENIWHLEEKILPLWCWRDHSVGKSTCWGPEFSSPMRGNCSWGIRRPLWLLVHQHTCGSLIQTHRYSWREINTSRGCRDAQRWRVLAALPEVRNLVSNTHIIRRLTPACHSSSRRSSTFLASTDTCTHTHRFTRRHTCIHYVTQR